MPRKRPKSGIARRRNGSVADAASCRECEVSFNPPIARIDVETLAAQETYQGHAKTLRDLHGKTGRRSDGC